MLVLRNGRYFDGTGAPSRIATVVVNDGRVTDILDGDVAVAGADEVVDATGKWVMPGFLDTHTHYDAELLEGPGLPESVRHGVTTVFIGSCSLSTILSPPEDCADFFCRVEALPRDAVLPALIQHKTWHDPRSYIAGLESRALGPNLASYLGHSDLRTAVMGLKRAVDPSVRPVEAELKAMEDYLESALDAGYLGLSTMTNPWDKVGGTRYRSKRLPSTYATWGEYRRFHRILRRRGRVLQSAPNITTKVNVLLFLAETVGLGLRKALKTTLISAADTKADPWLANVLPRAASFVNRFLGGNFRWQTVPAPFEVYADGMDLVVFEEFGAGEAALHLADALQRRDLLADPTYRAWFRRDYEKRFSPRVWHRDLHDATIVSAPDPTLAGRTFGAIADDKGQHPVDTFLDLVVSFGKDLRWKTTIANHRPDVLLQLASEDSVHIGFADSGAHVRNMAFYNFPLHYLRAVHRARQAGNPAVSLEHAVHKLTGEQAEWFHIDAGTLRPGDRADIVVVDPDGLDDSLDGYHEAPMAMFDGLSRMVRRNDRAVCTTIVGGVPLFRDGTFTEVLGNVRTGVFLPVGEKVAPAQQAAVSQRKRSAS
jgi:N-acyl-D-aspartate/D-glutamate deacylase